MTEEDGKWEYVRIMGPDGIEFQMKRWVGPWIEPIPITGTRLAKEKAMGLVGNHVKINILGGNETAITGWLMSIHHGPEQWGVSIKSHYSDYIQHYELSYHDFTIEECEPRP